MIPMYLNFFFSLLANFSIRLVQVVFFPKGLEQVLIRTKDIFKK